MVTVLLRTVIIYLTLIAVMRLMGKRQIGELEISDLATTFLISEIASLPITDTELPLSHALIPIIALLTLEVIISVMLSRFPKIKPLFRTSPSTLIKDGVISQKAMRDARISFDELFSELRQQGVDDISHIKYAILEQNGNITVIQKARYLQPSAEQLHLKPKETGLFHIVIEEGIINKHGLINAGISEKQLQTTLSKKMLSVKDVYLMMINDAGEIRTVTKENRK